MTDGISIERRVIRDFVGLTALAAVFFAFFVLFVAYIVEDAIIDRILDDEGSYLMRVHSQTDQLPEPRFDYMALYTGIAEAPGAVSQALSKHPDRREIFTEDERHFHVRYLYLSDESRPLLVAEVSSLLVVTNMSTSLLMFLVAILGLIIGLAIWLAYRLAKQTVQPIMQLSEEVQRRGQGRNELILTAAGRSDEVGYLAGVIQNSLSELGGALDRESHFTRDVSHELRTPLTVMKNTLSLVSERPVEPADIDLLRQSVDHMQATVTNLLGLAREESVQLQPVKLRPIVEESILAMDASLEALAFHVEVSLPDSFSVTGNSHLVALLVANLIENAIRYAAEPRLDISLNSDCIHFSNPVSRPVADDVTAPSRKDSDSQGLGQGLFLVKRLAEAMHWRLSTTTEGRIFSVIVQFPQS